MEKSKNALITGATSGIGTVIVDHLVKSGYSVVILGRSEEKLKSLASNLSATYPSSNISTVICELSSIESTIKACDEVKNSCDSIDLLILNAGLWNFEPIQSKNAIEKTLNFAQGGSRFVVTT